MLTFYHTTQQFNLIIAFHGPDYQLCASFQAIQTIDGEINQQLSSRRKHRESTGSAYFDGNAYGQGSMGILPEALRPKPGHLSNTQQRVYEVSLIRVQ